MRILELLGWKSSTVEEESSIEKAMPKTVPTKEAGASGTAIHGGYIETEEQNPKLSNKEARYKTATDILVNISIIGAGLRYFLNLVSKPSWTVTPADESPEAAEYAKFVGEVMNDMQTSWPRIIRRCATYRFHGFSINEWIAKKRKDGKIGFEDIEPRPQRTIERWEVNDKGKILGVWQLPPQTGQELPIERSKFIYMVDDMLTDSPEGLGWFRQLVEPAERMKAYLALETIGFERDLSGTPIGRAPISAINAMVKDGKMTKAEASKMIAGITNFVKLQAKKNNTGMVLDSQHFKDTTSDGQKNSAVPQWGVELLSGMPNSMDALGKSIERLIKEMARIMGVESILVGSEGVGSLALSKDKSNNLYLQVNSTMIDMAGFMTRDFIDTLWALNGFPDDMKPKMKTEDVAYKDVESITQALVDIAKAGSPLPPNDPAINEIRDLLGIPRASIVDEAMDAAIPKIDVQTPTGQSELTPAGQIASIDGNEE